MRTALALCAALLVFLWAPVVARADFGLLPGSEGFSVSATDEGGSADLQAGSHPWELTTTINFKPEAPPGEPGGPYTDSDPRDIHIEEPAGLIENPAAVPTCGVEPFESPRSSPFEASRSGESCPDKSQIGVATLRSSLGTRSFGVYNLVAPPGFPARIGFSPFGVPIVLTPHVRQAGGEYGVSLDLRNLTQSFDPHGLELSLWGTPWSVTHNTERGDCLNESDPEDPWGKCSVGRPRVNPPQAYLTLPPSCSGPSTTTLSADSWEAPGAYLPDGEPDLSDPAWISAAATAPQGQGGCDLVPFSPEAQGRLSSDRAASPVGYDLEFTTSEAGLTNPKLIAPTQPRRAVVGLPEGITINPSLAAGLGVCTHAQYEAETVSSLPGAGCPNASKIGTFIVQSPLFAEPVAGSLFLAKPHQNPFGTLLGLYVIAKAPGRGIIVKLAGKLEPDPQSGRLRATFEGLPQLPYTHFDVHFREGQRSPLMSPPSCGAYATAIELTPWLADASPPHLTSPLQIGHGPEGSACPSGAPPFHPAAAAGTINANAGSYSPFYLHLARADTEAEFTSYSDELPPGLLGKIAGIPYCPDAAIAAAANLSGLEEEAHPSCPAASQIGHTYTGYGGGSVLAYAPGGLYLAGPYHGAPLSIVAIDAATVGPFDLGTIVIRSAIEVDPRTAQLSVDSSGSDPIPHILQGIPLHLRDIRVYIDRPGVTVNPTSCNPSSVVSSLTGSYAPFLDPRAEASIAPVNFQASNCSSLSFGPRFALRLGGSTKHGGYPSLRATVTPRPGDANIAAAAVTLPPSLFLEQAHIRRPCTQPELQAEACRPEAQYGSASAVTPLLSEPLKGPVYLSSNRENQSGLPDLVAVLHSQGIRIVLDGKIDKNRGGIRATFQGLPDAPLTKFTMALDGGKGGLLSNEKDLCSSPQIASARFLGQDNGGVILRPALGRRCRSAHKKRAAHAQSHGGRR